MGAGDASERNSNRKCLERERVKRCMGTALPETKFVSFADEDEEANKKGLGTGKCKRKGQGKNRDSHDRAPGKSSNASTSQDGTRPLKPMHPSTRPCLKCGSRDHESGKCPENQEHRSHMAHAMGFHSVVFGFRRDEL